MTSYNCYLKADRMGSNPPRPDAQHRGAGSRGLPGRRRKGCFTRTKVWTTWPLSNKRPDSHNEKWQFIGEGILRRPLLPVAARPGLRRTCRWECRGTRPLAQTWGEDNFSCLVPDLSTTSALWCRQNISIGLWASTLAVNLVIQVKNWAILKKIKSLYF